MRLSFVPLAIATFVALASCQQGPSGPTRTSGPAATSTSAPLLATPGFETNWARAGISDQQKAQDLEDCYYSSRAQVAHDQAIDQDRYAGRDGTIGAETRAFQSRMSRFEERNRQISLFNECMTAKGYTPAPLNATAQ